MSVHRTLPAALDPRARLSVIDAIVAHGSSPTLRLGLHVVVATVVVLALLVGAAHSEPLAQQAPTAQPQNTFTADELGALQQKAEKGDAAAQSSQGSGDDSGRGVPKDRSQAAAWYRKAAEQGDAKAQFNLGLMYRYGPSYSPGLERWVEVFGPAPGHAGETAPGSPAARYNPGSGIPKDHIEAHKWMSLAAARATGGDQKRFADARDSLAKIMTPEQIAEAQKRASEWTAAFEKRKKQDSREREVLAV
jgi:TPR repeat protein